MITHQAIGMDHCAVSLSCGFKIGKKFFPVALTLENILSFITSCCYVVICTGICNAYRSRHCLLVALVTVYAFSLSLKLVNNEGLTLHVLLFGKKEKPHTIKYGASVIRRHSRIAFSHL